MPFTKFSWENEDKNELEFRENDTLVLVGEIRDIKRFLHE